MENLIKQLLKEKNLNPKSLAKDKRRLASFLNEKEVVKTSRLLEEYLRLLKSGQIERSEKLENFLRTRQVRTLSGVAVVTVLTKPFKCPGQCLYCPDEKGMPKSYLKNEPAAARAHMAKFDPATQMQIRLRALRITGHQTDKIELIVLGGTWSAYPEKYQYWFLKECFRAANEFQSGAKIMLPLKKQPRPNQTLNQLKAALKKEQRRNEKTRRRIVGLTLETRPDYIDGKELFRMRELGCTRVELGVQSINDAVLKLNRRGHGVEKTIQATALLKNAGFKVNYHMMVNLPGSTLKEDRQQFKELFSNSDFQPDLLKIYPCSVLATAPLFALWQKKKYRPYRPEQLKKLLIQIKQLVPPYVRIQRVIRDIPKESIAAGSEISNLRQLIHREMAEKNLFCQCIRCREAKNEPISENQIKLFRQDYKASNGQEVFLSFEDKTRQKLFALLRLRLPQLPPLKKAGWDGFYGRFSVLKDASLIREVHTYGTLVPLKGKQNKKALQHQGLGKRLIKEAEKITRQESNFKKIAVISGVGVRGYYRRLGYRLKDEYLVKKIR